MSRRLFKLFNRYICGVFIVIAVLGLAGLQGCGSTAGSSTTTTSGETATAGDAEASSWAMDTAMTTIQTSLGEEGTEAVSSMTLISPSKNKYTTATIATSSEVECPLGGTAGMTIDVEISVTGSTATVTGTVESTFDNCEYQSNVADDCLVSGAMDGGMTCALDITLSGEALDEMSGTMVCNTESACSGLTITVGDTETTMGIDEVSISASENEVQSYTGTICVNDVTYDDLTVFDEANFEADDFSCVASFFTECTSDSDCASVDSDAVCEDSLGICFDACSENAECDAAYDQYDAGSVVCQDLQGQYEVASACLPSCTTNDDCTDYGPGLECMVTGSDSGVCTGTAGADSDTDTDTTGDFYTTCTTDSQCTAYNSESSCVAMQGAANSFCLVTCSAATDCDAAFSGTYVAGDVSCVMVGPGTSLCMPGCSSDATCASFGVGLACDTSTFSTGICMGN